MTRDASGRPSALRAKGKSAYWRINATEMQRGLRSRRQSFGAVVYWRPGCRDADELTRHFIRIADAGFDAVRCHNFDVEHTSDGEVDYSIPDAWMSAASRTGVRVILHLNAQRESPSALLLPAVERYRGVDALLAWAGFGEPGPVPVDLENEDDGAMFADWLRDHYDSVDQLDDAWNVYPESGRLVTSFDDAWRLARLPEGRDSVNGVSNAKLNYGAQRDRYRFSADAHLNRVEKTIRMIQEIDPDHPVFTGSHQLFLNQPGLGWDIPRWARQTHDYFKGGATSAYETTGGPVQFSGGYGNHMDSGLMRRLCLAYLAAGNQSLAFWTWNHRPGGWEGGEYGMTSLSGQMTEWAREAGRISRCARTYAHELWEASPDAEVGLIQSWNTDVIQLLEPDRHDLPGARGAVSEGTSLCHGRSWIGYSRALMNGQISWHYVPEDELASDLIYNYPVIVAPFLRAASDETIGQLSAYVEAGGVLIADVMFGLFDQWGRMRRAGEQTATAELFGSWVDQVHDNRTGALALAGDRLPGFYGDLVPTSAQPLLPYEDETTAVAVQRRGRGTAILVGFDLGTACFAPGAGGFEDVVRQLVRTFVPRRLESSLPLTMRTRTPAADHYFIMNDGPGTRALITTEDAHYLTAVDVLSEFELAARPVLTCWVPERSGVWIRCEREEEIS